MIAISMHCIVLCTVFLGPQQNTEEMRFFHETYEKLETLLSKDPDYTHSITVMPSISKLRLTHSATITES